MNTHVCETEGYPARIVFSLSVHSCVLYLWSQCSTLNVLFSMEAQQQLFGSLRIQQTSK